jgi:two-component system cell cycle response regulator
MDFLNARILVVDDCARSALSLTEVLRMDGYAHVEATSDPALVFTLHVEKDYDLILLDLSMPGVSGFAVMRALRKAHAEDYLPVMVVTGSANQKYAALEAGALDVIIKPYDLLELKVRIRNTLTVRLLYKTSVKQARDHQAMALHDVLTGLPNRRLLLDRIEKGLQNAKRARNGLAVLYVDLDGFKAVNDRHGHACGDALLQAAAGRLADGARQADTVSRISGDEFVIVVPDMQHPEAARAPAEKIIQNLSVPFIVDALLLDISASVGIAVYPEDGDTALLLLQSADRAMYEAKRAGRNRCHFAASCG